MSSGGLPIGKAGGIGGIIIALITMFLGGGSLLDGGSASGFDLGNSSIDSTNRVPIDPANDPDAATVDLASFLMADIQETWDQLFADAGRQYTETKMVIFSDAVQTGCGNATAAVGPFYCPPWRQQGLYRPRVLRRARQALWRSRRLRPVLRHCARGRPPHPIDLRH
ncbi:MAG: neutral zinc metallopeptidase [Acidimicrobiales bacterium]